MEIQRRLGNKKTNGDRNNTSDAAIDGTSKRLQSSTTK